MALKPIWIFGLNFKINLDQHFILPSSCALGAIWNAGPNLFQNTDKKFILALEPWEVSTNIGLSQGDLWGVPAKNNQSHLRYCPKKRGGCPQNTTQFYGKMRPRVAIIKIRENKPSPKLHQIHEKNNLVPKKQAYLNNKNKLLQFKLKIKLIYFNGLRF